ncbi:MAG: flavodoxin family protein, partial [Spirochaetota bacterium]
MPGSKTSIRICSFFGSPRRHGDSSRLHESFLQAFPGAEIDSFYPAFMNITGCTGCGACSAVSRCVFDDDMRHIYESVRKARIIAFSFPLYFTSPPSQMKAVIDRCNLLWHEQRRGEYPASGQKGIAF